MAAIQIKILPLFFIIFSALNNYAQVAKSAFIDTASVSSNEIAAYKNVYDLKLKKELIISIPATALFISSLLVQPKELSQDDLLSLNASDIPAFERNTIYFDSITALKADMMSDYFNYGTFALAFIAFFSAYENINEIPVNLALYAEGSLIYLGFTGMLKNIVGRIRPYAYNTNYSFEYRLRGEVTSSFPSGHTSSSAFNCFFTAKMIDDYLINDENKLLETINWSLAATIPALVGYLRMEAGVHFFTDVLGGYAIGAACGYFIPEIHQMKNNNVSFYPIIKNNYSGLNCLVTF